MLNSLFGLGEKKMAGLRCLGLLNYTRIDFACKDQKMRIFLTALTVTAALWGLLMVAMMITISFVSEHNALFH